MKKFRDEAKISIINFLSDRHHQPSTLKDILEYLKTGMTHVHPSELLPIAIEAMADLQREGKVTEYEECPWPGDDPLEFAWELYRGSAKESRNRDFLSYLNEDQANKRSKAAWETEIMSFLRQCGIES